MRNIKRFLAYGCFAAILLLGVIGLIDWQSKDLATSPEDSWSKLTNAMYAGDIEQIQTLTTKQGFESIQDRPTLEENMLSWQGWGYSELQRKTRWEYVTTKKAIIYVGDESKVSRYIFIKTRNGWKLDEFTPGS